MRFDKIIDKKKPVILTLNYNELYLYNMISLLTDYQIVVYQCTGYKPLHEINERLDVFTAETITPDIIPDVVICQYIEYHYETCREIADTYGCPLIKIGRAHV